jgi:cellulose synthase (UDP-forming)
MQSSPSLRRAERLDTRAVTARRALVVVGWLLLANYFWWRASSTIPLGPSSLAAMGAIAFFAFELVNGIVFGFNQWHSNPKLTNRSAEVEAHLAWFGDSPPLVDIFIATYNESLAVLNRTLVAAEAVSYPRRRIWVLDDGNRPWLAEHARKRGVGYLSRVERDGYKSGSLNHAIGHVCGLQERPGFIAVLDADFVAFPDFVSRCMALMHDPQVALVQTPQEFFNPDPFQFAFAAGPRLPDDLRNFYRTRLRGMDGAGGTSCCGTSFLMRVEHLLAVGGFSSDSITEDMLTSMKFRRNGYRCLYLGEPLSVGLAAEDLQQYLVQRARWAVGLMQAGHTRWSPAHRRAWPIAGFYHATFTLKRLLGSILLHAYLWIPIVTWAVGPVIIAADLSGAVAHALPILIYRAVWSWLERGASLPLLTDAMGLVAGCGVIPASIRALFDLRRPVFAVTKKDRRRDQYRFYWGPLAYFCVVLALTVAALAIEPLSTTLTDGQRRLMVIWSVYDIVAALIALVPCIERPKHRRSERFEAVERVTVQLGDGSHEGRLDDISEGGCALSGVPSLHPGARLRLELSSGLHISGKVVRRRNDGSCGVEFQATDAENDALIRHIYCSRRYVVIPESWNLFTAFGTVLTGTLRAALELGRWTLGRFDRRVTSNA